MLVRRHVMLKIYIFILIKQAFHAAMSLWFPSPHPIMLILSRILLLWYYRFSSMIFFFIFLSPSDNCLMIFILPISWYIFLDWTIFLSINFILFFYCCSSRVVSIFTPPHPPGPPITASHPRTYPPWLCPCVLYTYSLMALPLLSPIILSPILSGYCEFVLHFNVSGCILLACLFCWLCFTDWWDHMIFVLHCLA